LAFPDPAESPVKELMAPGQRQQTASELNSAILSKYCQEEEPKLASLLKLLAWGQEKLSASVKFPTIDDVIAATNPDGATAME
jgi:glucose-induced degradation protein 8